jgi:hypothetical protein
VLLVPVQLLAILKLVQLMAAGVVGAHAVALAVAEQGPKLALAPTLLRQMAALNVPVLLLKHVLTINPVVRPVVISLLNLPNSVMLALAAAVLVPPPVRGDLYSSKIKKLTKNLLK